MECKFCGTKLKEKDKFCSSCGARLAETTKKEQEVQPVEENKETTSKESEPTKKKGLAIASLVLGICGVCFVSFVCSLLAVIFGSLRIKKVEGVNNGRGFAIAGLVLGIIGLLINFIVFINSVTKPLNFFLYY